ncbi:YciI family protein [Renibacterium salmoninarum]|nr:YciI family protein [Renibacterium salmoninarum]
MRTDGPYSTGAEMVGGFYLVNAESLEEATELASNIPMFAGDAVEIRPVMTDLDRPEALRATNLR